MKDAVRIAGFALATVATVAVYSVVVCALGYGLAVLAGFVFEVWKHFLFS